MNAAEIREEVRRVVLKERLFKSGELADEAAISPSHLSNFVNEKRQLGPEGE